MSMKTYWKTCRNYYIAQARRCSLGSNRTYFVHVARDCNHRMLRNSPPAVLNLVPDAPTWQGR
jgi:hypothetical protein